MAIIVGAVLMFAVFRAIIGYHRYYHLKDSISHHGKTITTWATAPANGIYPSRVSANFPTTRVMTADGQIINATPLDQTQIN